MERNDYEAVACYDGTRLQGNVAQKIVGFNFVEGMCATDYPAMLRMDRDTYLREVIKNLVEGGKISDREERDKSGKIIKYDDRKLRTDGALESFAAEDFKAV